MLEREAEPGGIPRHANHTGFGIRDLRRVMTGPAYARRWAKLARDAGVEVRLETMVTEWAADRTLLVTGPGGRTELTPAAVVLATGCRERPRSARLVPGSRPAGVITTSTLQQLVYLQHRRVGRRAVVVGAEHVSFSAVATLAHGGASTAALVTELERHQSLAAFKLGAALRYRVPVWTRTAVTRIDGGSRVEGVELTDLDSGETREVPCDLVVFTADWIPDHELAAMAGCEIDPGTRGPRADSGLRTSVAGRVRRRQRGPPGRDRRHVRTRRPPRRGDRRRARQPWARTLARPRAGPREPSAALGGAQPGGARRPAPAREPSPAPLRGVPARAPDRGRAGRTRAVGRPARAPRPGTVRAHPRGAGPRRSIPREAPSAFGWLRGGLDERGQHRRLTLLRMPQHAEREPTVARARSPRRSRRARSSPSRRSPLRARPPPGGDATSRSRARPPRRAPRASRARA